MEYHQERNSPNKWTEEQCEFLCVLQRWFTSNNEDNLSRSDRRKIFYARFASKFLNANENSDITSQALSTFFNQLKLDERPIWKRTCIETPFTDPENVFQPSRSVIQKIVLVFELDVTPRDRDPLKLMHRSPNWSSRRTRVWDLQDDNESADLLPCEDFMPSSPTQPNRAVIATSSQQDTSGPNLLTTAPRTPTQQIMAEAKLQAGKTAVLEPSGNLYSDEEDFLPLSHTFDHKDRQGNQVRARRYDPHCVESDALQGSIGFRTWDESNNGINTTIGFWAGSLAPSFSPAPDRNSELWAETTNVHLRPLPEPSCWVSIWLTLVPALHRLLKSDEGNLTFIDADYLARDTTSEFPKIYSAKTAISQYGLRKVPYPGGRPYTYRGGSEYIVWQDIEPHAVISTITRQAFEAHLSVNPDLGPVFAIEQLRSAKFVCKFRKLHKRVWLNCRVGIAAGKFLSVMKTPRRFVTKAALMTARNWEFVKGQANSEETYMSGIWAGYDDAAVLAEDIVNDTLLVNPASCGIEAAESDGDYVDSGDEDEDKDGDTVMGNSDDELVDGHFSEAESWVAINNDGAEMLNDNSNTDAPSKPIRHPDSTGIGAGRTCDPHSAEPHASLPTSQPHSDPIPAHYSSTDNPSSHLPSHHSPTRPASTHGLPPQPSISLPTSAQPFMSPPDPQPEARFQTALFRAHVTAQQQRAEQGLDSVGQLRQQIKKYRLDGSSSGSPTAGKTRNSPIALDDSDDEDSEASRLVRESPALDVLGEGTGRGGDARRRSVDSFTERRRWIEEMAQLPPYQNAKAAGKRKAGI